MWLVREKLCISDLSAGVQPVLPKRAGPEREQAAGFRSETAMWFSEMPKEQTADSEVRFPSLIAFLICVKELLTCRLKKVP